MDDRRGVGDTAHGDECRSRVAPERPTRPAADSFVEPSDTLMPSLWERELSRLFAEADTPLADHAHENPR